MLEKFCFRVFLSSYFIYFMLSLFFTYCFPHSFLGSPPSLLPFIPPPSLFHFLPSSTLLYLSFVHTFLPLYFLFIFNTFSPFIFLSFLPSLFFSVQNLYFSICSGDHPTCNLCASSTHSLGVKWPESETDHSPSNDEVKNTSISPYVFMAW
jgi:hypothetical protein